MAQVVWTFHTERQWGTKNDAPLVGAQSGSTQSNPELKFPFLGGVARRPTFDAESKNPKIQNSHFRGVGGLLAGQLLMLSPKILKSKIPISGGGGGLLAGQLLMLSPKILKSWNSHFLGGGVARRPTFDAESKNPIIQNSHFWEGGGLFTNQVFKCSKSNLHRGRLFHQ